MLDGSSSSYSMPLLLLLPAMYGSRRPPDRLKRGVICMTDAGLLGIANLMNHSRALLCFALLACLFQRNIINQNTTNW